ncbi:MAG: Mov34/MPN/PAD-1 family protein [Candidatus Bathyarchaeota archaeon]|nr:Mov34/MPN/PAD-1 family protein [Candidatus Bathyarchaeota archaeon]
MYKEILLSDKAFIGIVLSSVEVYKKECLGALVGVQTLEQIIVEHAIPFQAVAKRTFTEVKPNWRKELKVNELIPQLMHLQKLGYFHSHPQFGDHRGETSLSKYDKESMQETEIEIVVAINEAKRSSWWTESGKELSGTLEGHNIRIAGFYREENGRIKKCKIVCSYAVGFDYAFRRR